MATSPNFSWPEPDNSDLVKNGALAIRTAVDAIDSSMADLKGGTTGQVLSKTSNTDMDFTWVAQDDSNAIQNAIVDAKGDLIAATAADTPARLAVGANKTVLTADSTASTGIKWGLSGLTLLTRTGFTGSSSVVVDNVFSSTYETYCIVIEDVIAASSSGADLLFQFRYGSTTRSSGYYGSCGTLPRNLSIWSNAGSINAASLQIATDIGVSGGGITCSTLWVNQVGSGTSQRGSIRGNSFNGANFDPSVIGGGCDTIENFTGFVLSSSENITGAVSVYGMAI